MCILNVVHLKKMDLRVKVANVSVAAWLSIDNSSALLLAI
jgi:hypothetical protein